QARRRGVTTILNPAPVPDAPLEVWRDVDYLTPNAGEAARLGGVDVTDRASAADAARTLRDRGVATVVVTLGAHGALPVTAAAGAPVGPAGAVAPAPGIPGTAVDTTAAGDAFNAALAVALGERMDRAEALRFANATAALACTRRGAQPSLPSRSEVTRLLGG